MATNTPAVKSGVNDYYSATEVAAFLGIHRVTAYRLGEQGKIPRVKVGSIVRFPAREINELLHLTTDEVA